MKCQAFSPKIANRFVYRGPTIIKMAQFEEKIMNG
jgi:hypothetical protein